MLLLPLAMAFDYQTNNYASSTGLQIFLPKQDYFKSNQNFSITALVLNSTNDWLISNSTISCRILTFNKTGDVLFNSSMTLNNYGNMFYIINAASLSNNGFYTYNIFCNSSNEEGMVSSAFKMTPTGDSNDNNSNAFIGVILIIFGVIIVLIIVAERLEFGVFTDLDGTPSPAFKYLAYLLSGWILLIPIDMSRNIIELYNIMSSYTVQVIYNSFIAVLILFSLLFMFGYGFKAIQKLGLFNSKD